jgi:uncharacterized protein YjbI with pentapeptide repeats
MRTFAKLTVVLVMWLAASWWGTLSALQAADYVIPKDLKDLRPAESLVLEKMVQGGTADLSELRKRYGDADARPHLRPRFLEALLGQEFERLKVHREGVRIENAVITGPVKLVYETVPYAVEFKDCHFQGQVTFRDCTFQKDLKLDKSTFDEGLTFQSKVEINLSLSGSVFKGEARFAGAQVGSELLADKAEFRGSVGFQGVKVGRSAYFSNTKFLQRATFYRATIGEDLNIVVAEFQGEAVFTGVQIGRGFMANGVKFYNDEKTADFSRLEVKQLTNLTNSVFKGPVNFSKAKIGDATVGGEEVKGVIAERAEFNKDATFDGAQFSDLVFAHVNVRDLKLVRTTVEQQLRIEDANITNLDASHLVVKGHTILKDLRIEQEANFTECRLQALELVQSPTPKTLVMGGMSYQGLTPVLETGNQLFEWIKKSKFDTQNYRQLEAYFQRCGYEGRADDVYIAMKHAENERRGFVGHWATFFLWEWPAGYGRRPLNILWGSLIVFLLGMFIFRSRHVELGGESSRAGKEKNLTEELTGKSETQPQWVSKPPKKESWHFRTQALISLDHFLPALNLGFIIRWRFETLSILITIYVIIHRMMGYLFLSIAIATLIGSFR